MKELRCRDVGFDCDGVVRGDSADDVLQRAAVHAREVHDVVEFSPEQITQIRAQLHDVPGGESHLA